MTSPCSRITVAVTVLSLLWLLPAAPVDAAPITQLELEVVAADSGEIVSERNGGQRRTITVANGTYDFEIDSSLPVARMRMEARNNSCPLERIPDVATPDDPRTTDDDGDFPRFTTGVLRASGADMTCDVVFNAWYENHKWAGHLFVTLVFEPADPTNVPDSSEDPDEVRRWEITTGTSRSTEMDTDTPADTGSAHGVRVYCPISHFAYEDPIVKPGQPNSSHLHMFWGNTGTDAESTAESLLAGPGSSCEGGSNNLSAYWMPAVFNDDGEVMIPESAITYYKSFGNNPRFVRDTIQPIPNGLQMIADLKVENNGDWNIYSDRAEVRGVPVVRFHIAFPQCVAVHPDGSPVLSSPEPFFTHTAYAVNNDQETNCPGSHPYRIPQVIYNVRFALDADAGFTLSSPTLHADYIAAWDEESMRRITRCNIEERHMCQFRDLDEKLRTQLPERFAAPDGTPLYEASDQLIPAADRTPFGAALTPMPS